MSHDRSMAIPSANDEPATRYATLEESGNEVDVGTSLQKKDVVSLSPFERCDETAKWSWIGIGVSSIIGVGCTITGLTLGSLRGGHQPIFFSSAAMEITQLSINFVITLCIDCIGYVHATSLRWALYREGRLEFNTNLRLFRSAKSSVPNWWPCNLTIAFCLILCYASTSQLIINYKESPGPPNANGPKFSFNFVALAALGLGLIGQVIPAALCMLRSDSHVVSWSSNPLNNTLAVLHSHGTVRPRPGRCMKGLSQLEDLDSPSRPLFRHKSLWQLRGTRWIISLLWVLSALPFGGVIGIVIGYSRENGFGSLNWSVKNVNNPYPSFDAVPMVPDASTTSSSQIILCILFLWAVQALQATGLHCAELLVNIRRDEKVWRQATSRKGATMTHLPLAAMLRSWESVLLFIFKSTLHWLLGIAAQAILLHDTASSVRRDIINASSNVIGNNDVYYPGYGMTLYINYTILLIYGFLTLLVVIFATWLALHRPGGYQPAAWGHLQTLADLVDDWDTSAGGKFWWGDKGGGVDGVRHAGTATSYELVGPIDPNKLYAGGRFRGPVRSNN